ncbi:riboflavin synthase subunit alpha [Gluconobacter thailandicus F149-1 = NBRC 100600]|uniref:Riboflavin synthase n=1 Tax=Gluconobacter thailandicus NBRC 3257 TaxID=1381097 RepID=A0ABQ0IVN7_GLUTH|nr:riboflavin synthase [Gluconobacter thailandicus]GAN89711.1 riboflavin synthase subunit alpha [Gluconobacter frateurii M-2]KXV53963.1 riboflavin synthase subunit alpha [Gluconobacter thailandicus]GAC89307.1 riboflavin synthase subunit alpha [Gluconobacter thailandicus NBRC 3255]GAD26275.1 riboflavin synthase subunit alpha [Gluconobacter thailandicus NBRC 3257]GAN92584.1 riboflavin synthase subunit alpha [Gluconobacter thailandicus F149-1 = NBRC 100600]
MFSGIVERLGTVRSVSLRDKAMDLTIETGFPDLELGESVAINGVCLTVETFDATGLATFHLSGETLSRTPLDQLKAGSKVNLERAVAASTRLSGHIVQGHVDNVATLASVQKAGDSYALRVFVPQDLRQYVVEKGSITFDGISLTVNELHDGIVRGNQTGFEVGLTIIPHTWEHTNLSSLEIGTRMNVEVDVLSKYVENLLRFSPTLGKVAS